MPGLVPGIHVFLAISKDVDARHEATAVRFGQNDCNEAGRLAMSAKFADLIHDFRAFPDTGPCRPKAAEERPRAKLRGFSQSAGFARCGEVRLSDSYDSHFDTRG